MMLYAGDGKIDRRWWLVVGQKLVTPRSTKHKFQGKDRRSQKRHVFSRGPKDSKTATGKVSAYHLNDKIRRLTTKDQRLTTHDQ
jgi:hypothetical protein